MALVIVLGFVVLLCLLVVTYFSRTTTDRELAHSSISQTNSDALARSAANIILADFKQEIASGSTTSFVNGAVLYTPTSAANIVPQRSGGNVSMPNLVRRSVNADPMTAPGVASRASAINSATNPSLNGRSVSPARWNTHYLIPKLVTSDDSTDPIAVFTAPDWVLVSRNGPFVQTSLGSGPTALNDPTDTNNNFVIGRYA